MIWKSVALRERVSVFLGPIYLDHWTLDRSKKLLVGPDGVYSLDQISVGPVLLPVKLVKIIILISMII